MPRRRRRAFPIYKVVRATVAAGLVVLLIAVLAYCAALLLIDPNGYKPEIEAAVKRATGRTLNLRGPMRLAFGVPPWLIADDITLSNPAGLSRLEMATVDRVEARVAVWPLLVGEIDLTDLSLFRPDVLLERDADGRGNWLLAPERPGGEAAAPAQAGTDQGASGGDEPPVSPLAQMKHSRSTVAFQSIHIEDGRIGWARGGGAAPVRVDIPRVDADASGPNGTLLLSGSLVTGGRTLRLSGEVGSLERLFDSAGVVPWPVQVALQDRGTKLSVVGGIGQPTRGRGLDLQIEATIGDFSGIGAFLPPWLTPPHDATLSMHWGDGKPDGPIGLSGMTLHIGALRLPRLLPGVDINHADLSAPALDRPVHLDIEGSSSAGDTRLVMNTAALADVLPGAHPANPVPIDLTLDVGRALISAKGTVIAPLTLKGVDMEVFVRLPDVAAMGQVVQRRLPPLSQMAFEGEVIGDIQRGGAVGIRKGVLTLPEAQLSGDLDVRLGARPSVHGTLTSPRVDVDSLLADMAGPWGTMEQRAAGPADAAPAAAAAAPAEASAGEPAMLIPDTAFDYRLLDLFDAEVQIRVDSLQYAGIGYTQVGTNLNLRDGKLALDPFDATMPGGPFSAQFTLDSRAKDRPATLVVTAQAVQLAPLLALIGDKAPVSGSVWINGNLQANARSPRAIAASVDGYLGLASVDAEVDNRLLSGLMRAAKLPDVPLSSSGLTKLRCVALRLDAVRGAATVGALVVDTPRLAVVGGGNLDFGQELLALQLRPLVRLGSGTGAAGVVVPVHVGGSFLAPAVGVGVEPGGKSGPPITGEKAADPCVPALAAVRAAPPPRPKPEAQAPVAASAAPAKPEGKSQPTAMDVLKELIK